MSKLNYQVVTVNVSQDFAANLGPIGAFWRDFVAVNKLIRAVELISVTPGLSLLWFIGQANHDTSTAIPVFPGKLYEDDEKDPAKWFNDGIGYGVVSAPPSGSFFTVAVYQ